MLGRGNAAAGERVTTIIGKETDFQGNLTGKGSLRIDGKMQGDVNFTGDVYIGETARITANVKARNLTVAGEVRGNVQVSGRLELVQSGKLYGDMHAKTLVVAEGALFKGSSEMGGREEAPSRERIASDIA